MITKQLSTMKGFALEWGKVGSYRYFYIRHIMSGKLAASFDTAPCKGNLKPIAVAFLNMMQTLPADLISMNAETMSADHIAACRKMRTLFVRADAVTYNLNEAYK